MKFKSYICIKARFAIAFFAIIIVSITSIVNPVWADEEPYKSLRLFTNVLEELEANYVDDVDTQELIHNAIKGMVGNLDPHSSFMPPEAFTDLQDDTKGEFS